MLKNRLLYLLAIICTASIMTMYQNYYIIMAMALILIMPVILLVLLIVLAGNIEVSVNVDAAAITKSDEIGIPVTIDIENRCHIPLTCARLSIRFKNHYLEKPSNEHPALAAACKNHTRISYFFKAENIGIIDISIVNAVIYDFFGLWHKKIKINKNTSVSVIPELIPVNIDIEELSNAEDSETEKYREDIKGNDNGEVFDIREYSEGDRIKSIHWKLSSKKDVLIVKEFSMPFDKIPLIIVNMQKASIVKKQIDLDRLERLLEAVMSLSHAMAAAGIYHDVAWHDTNSNMDTRKSVNYEQDVLEVIDSLLNTELSNTFPISGGLIDNSSVHEYNRIFYITPILNEEIVNFIYGIKENTQTTIIHITKNKTDEGLKDLCIENDIELLSAERIDELSN